jgi:hypothetical protein
MKRPLLEIYALAVCLFTIACFAITLGVALYDIVQVSAPAFTLSADEYERHQSDEAFQSYVGRRHVVALNSQAESVETGAPAKSSPKITRQREESFRHAINAERRSGFQSLVRTSIIMLVSSLVFWLHWRLAAYSRRENQPN